MTDPNKELLGDPRIPQLVFGGRAWPVPKMSLDDIELLTPLLSESAAAMSKERIRALADVVFIGLRRGHKAMTREEFNDIGTDFTELLEAWLVVGRQAGFMKAKGGASSDRPLAQEAAASQPTTAH